MTNQQELRERIYKTVCAHRNSTTPDQFTDLLLALLSPPDTGLASLVGEIDALFEKRTPGNWEVADHPTNGPNSALIRTIYRDDQNRRVTSFPAELKMRPTLGNQINADLIVALVNNWPRIRAALTTGGG